MLLKSLCLCTCQSTECAANVHQSNAKVDLNDGPNCHSLLKPSIFVVHVWRTCSNIKLLCTKMTFALVAQVQRGVGTMCNCECIPVEYCRKQ